MKVTVRVQGRIFEVDIDHLENHPIIAKVDNREYEVTIEDVSTSINQQSWTKPELPLPKDSEQGNGKFIPRNGRLKKKIANDAIYSPIPGVVISIEIVENQEVQTGQIIGVIEAMKMKNFIRAPKNGTIRSVLVQVGQAVRANEVIAYYVA
ncbi:MAG: biotin/lipoyl-containing protein [Anaerolineales bacterium]